MVDFKVDVCSRDHRFSSSGLRKIVAEKEAEKKERDENVKALLEVKG